MSARQVVIHRGLCGVSLRTQCLSIGATYSIISSIGIFMASLMVNSPSSYIRLEEAITKEFHENISANYTEGDQGQHGQSATDELEAITNHLIRQVGQNAMEMLIGSLATLICSVMLVQGVRQNKTTWILPWIVESVISTVGSFLFFLVQVASPASLSLFKAFLVVIFFALSIYFILSVYSFYMILRIQKKSVTSFLDHEFEGGVGSFYHTLDEDDAALPPYREKTVPMTDEEDKGREHVLYAKI